MERSDKKLEHLKTYVVEIAMLEFIKDNNLIDNNKYKKIKIKIENEYAKYNKLNNSNISTRKSPLLLCPPISLSFLLEKFT